MQINKLLLLEISKLIDFEFFIINTNISEYLYLAVHTC